MRDGLDPTTKTLAKMLFLALTMAPAVGCVAEAGDGATAEAASAVSGDDTEQSCSGGGKHGHAVPVIFDTDMDFDDSAALAFLAAEHKMGRIDLRAVTVTNNGAGFPGQAIYHARCLLERFGLSDVPVADNAVYGPEQFPIQLRGAGELILGQQLAGCTQSNLSSAVSAEQLLLDTVVESERPVTIVTTGPMTNVAAAYRLSGGLGHRGQHWFSARVGRIFAMGGAVHVPGNAAPTATEDGTQEYNIWGDPAAADTVFRSFADVRLVALDATNEVPVSAAFAARVQADHSTPEADYISDLVSNPLIQFAIQANLGFFWWDPLDAVASQNGSVVTYEWDKISVSQSGMSRGRTQAVAPSQPGSWMRVGVDADQAAFEDVFLDTLNYRSSH